MRFFSSTSLRSNGSPSLLQSAITKMDDESPYFKIGKSVSTSAFTTRDGYILVTDKLTDDHQYQPQVSRFHKGNHYATPCSLPSDIGKSLYPTTPVVTTLENDDFVIAWMKWGKDARNYTVGNVRLVTFSDCNNKNYPPKNIAVIPYISPGLDEGIDDQSSGFYPGISMIYNQAYSLALMSHGNNHFIFSYTHAVSLQDKLFVYRSIGFSNTAAQTLSTGIIKINGKLGGEGDGIASDEVTNYQPYRPGEGEAGYAVTLNSLVTLDEKYYATVYFSAQDSNMRTYVCLEQLDCHSPIIKPSIRGNRFHAKLAAHNMRLVVVWESQDKNNNWQIWMNILELVNHPISGVLVTSQSEEHIPTLRVSKGISGTYNVNPAVVISDEGKILVVWEKYAQPDGKCLGLFSKQYDALHLDDSYPEEKVFSLDSSFQQAAYNSPALAYLGDNKVAINFVHNNNNHIRHDYLMLRTSPPLLFILYGFVYQHRIALVFMVLSIVTTLTIYNRWKADSIEPKKKDKAYQDDPHSIADPDCRINRTGSCAVSMFRKPKSRYPFHFFLIVEGVNENNSYVIRRHELVQDRHDKNFGFVKSKEAEGPLEDAEIIFYSSEYLDRQKPCGPPTCGISREKADELKKNVMNEVNSQKAADQTKRFRYHWTASTEWLAESSAGDSKAINCQRWAINKLKELEAPVTRQFS